MKRNIKGRRPRHRNKKRLILTNLIIIIAFVILVSVILYEYIDRRVMPIVITIAEMKIRTLATQSINDAVQKTLEETNINTNDLVTYYFDENNEITSFGIDTVKINEISAEIIRKIGEDVDRYYNETIPIPIGTIMGSRIFANMGPNINIEILPYGTAIIDYDREFRSAGINQINHRVWLNVETIMQVVVPLVTEQIIVIQQVTLVDRIIRGEVPPSYVNVPENNILDIAPLENDAIKR